MTKTRSAEWLKITESVWILGDHVVVANVNGQWMVLDRPGNIKAIHRAGNFDLAQDDAEFFETEKTNGEAETTTLVDANRMDGLQSSEGENSAGQ